MALLNILTVAGACRALLWTVAAIPSACQYKTAGHILVGLSAGSRSPVTRAAVRLPARTETHLPAASQFATAVAGSQRRVRKHYRVTRSSRLRAIWIGYVADQDH